MLNILLSFLALGALAVGMNLIGNFVSHRRSRKPSPSKKRIFVESVQAIAVTGAITLAITFALQWAGFIESKFYRPSQRNFGELEKLQGTVEEVWFESADGLRLNAVFCPAEDEALATVVHFHGSDRNISYTVRNAAWLRQHGFHVFAFDYRGYGKSEGEISKQGILNDGIAAIEYLRGREDLANIPLILWGQSMGGQLAIQAAERAGLEQIAAVVSEATYARPSIHAADKMGQMGPLWLLQWAGYLVTNDSYNAEEAIKNLDPARVLLVHGAEDRAVRPYHGDRLKASSPSTEYWLLEGYGHLRVFQDEPMRARLAEYMRKVAEDWARKH